MNLEWKENEIIGITPLLWRWQMLADKERPRFSYKKSCILRTGRGELKFELIETMVNTIELVSQGTKELADHLAEHQCINSEKSWRTRWVRKEKSKCFFYIFFKGSREETPANDTGFQSNIDIWEDSRPNLQELYL